MDSAPATPAAQNALQSLLRQALKADGSAPLLEATETMMKAAVRAAQLYPEWARAIAEDATPDLDLIAQHLAGPRSA